MHYKHNKFRNVHMYSDYETNSMLLVTESVIYRIQTRLEREREAMTSQEQHSRKKENDTYRAFKTPILAEVLKLCITLVSKKQGTPLQKQHTTKELIKENGNIVP